MPKCGFVNRTKYVQSDDFEILLFAYSLDGAPVQIVDLANDEKIPGDITAMLFREDCRKHAYNAAFEWYCLSKHFGVPANAWLPQWRCTMLHGLHCGFPAGLDSIGTALGLPQDKKKLAIGKPLISYFCKPCKPTAAERSQDKKSSRPRPRKMGAFQGILQAGRCYRNVGGKYSCRIPRPRRYPKAVGA